MVNVVVTTYNHKDFISQCLESILMQQTNFDFNIIIGEDDSNDGTRDICLDYANKHPNKIKLYLRRRSDVIYINKKPSGRFNFIESLKACDAKYIALCDGDDYWTDPLKLQKQVDFLETNLEYVICSHNVESLNTFSNEAALVPGNNKLLTYNLDNYIINNTTATCSLLFKKDALGSSLPEWFYKVPLGDWALLLLILKNSGKLCAVLPDVMGVYRIHSGGLHSNLYQNSKTFRNAFKQHLSFIKIIRKELLYEKKYRRLITKKQLKIHSRLYKLNLECKNFVLAFNHHIKSIFYRLKYKFL